VFRYTPARTVSGNFVDGGVLGFSLIHREDGNGPNIRLFTDNFRIGSKQVLPSRRVNGGSHQNYDSIDNIDRKASFIINFPGWSGIRLPNSNETLFKQKTKGTLSIFAGPSLEAMDRCLAESGYINFSTAKSIARDPLKALQNLHAESFSIQIAFPIIVSRMPGETIEGTIQVPAALLYVCPFAQNDKMRPSVHLDIGIDTKDKFIMCQKGFYIQEGFDDPKGIFHFTQEDLPSGAEDAVSFYMLDGSSEAGYYRRSWLNPDYCAVIVPPGGDIDIRYEKSGKKYKAPKISAGNTYVTLILSDLYPNDIILSSFTGNRFVTEIYSVFTGSQGFDVDVSFKDIFILGTSGNMGKAWVSGLHS